MYDRVVKCWACSVHGEGTWENLRKSLMSVDPCIIIQFVKKNPTRCNNVSEFCYSISIRSSTCFGRHTVHHQEPTNVLAASGLSYVEGCWTCSWWTLSIRGCQYSFSLLMMGGVSRETYWASYKYGIIKFRYIVASCWIFLYEFYRKASDSKQTSCHGNTWWNVMPCWLVNSYRRFGV